MCVCVFVPNWDFMGVESLNLLGETSGDAQQNVFVGEIRFYEINVRTVWADTIIFC